MSRKDLDAEVKLYEEAGVDTPALDSDELSNKGKVVDWLEKTAEEHGYTHKVTEEDIEANEDVEHDLEVGDVVLLPELEDEELSKEEVEKLKEQNAPSDNESDDEEDNDPEADEASDDDGEDSAEENEAEEVESKSLTEEESDYSFEGTYQAKRIDNGREKLVNGRIYVELTLEDMSSHILTQEEVENDANITKVAK